MQIEESKRNLIETGRANEEQEEKIKLLEGKIKELSEEKKEKIKEVEE